MASMMHHAMCISSLMAIFYLSKALSALEEEIHIQAIFILINSPSDKRQLLVPIQYCADLVLVSSVYIEIDLIKYNDTIFIIMNIIM